MERAFVELSIEPPENADLGRAQRLEPAIEQKVFAFRRRRDLGGLRNDGSLIHFERVGLRDILSCFRCCIESVQQLADPFVQGLLSLVMRERLNNADRQTVLGAIEIEDFFTRVTTLLLLPLKELFDLRMLDDCDPIVKVEKPLNHVRNGIVVDAPTGIAQERRFVWVGGWCAHSVTGNIERERRPRFANTITASICDGRGRIGRERREFAFAEHVELPQRLNYCRRTRAPVVAVFNF
jgi:hypothetical protein